MRVSPDRQRKNAPGNGGRRRETAEELRDVSVVIVNYNTGALLQQSVRAALAQSPVRECIVVDNASQDDSIGALRSAVRDERLTIRLLDVNLGFAAGCNVGIAAATGDFVLILNPDCLLEDNTVARLREEALAADDIGASGPLIRNMDGSEQRGCRRSVPTPWQIFCVGIGLHRLMPEHPRFRSFNRTGDALPERPSAIQGVSGACILIRRDAIDRVGLFDERYFLHFEDLDWCLRAGRAGLRIIFVPDAVARHVGGVSGRDRPIRVEVHKHTSLIRFVRANFAEFYPSAFIAFVSLIVYLRWLTIAVRILVLGKPQQHQGWYSLFVDSAEPKGGTAAKDNSIGQ